MKFTIRDLLWLTLVIAMGLGWAYDRLGLWMVRQHAIFGLEETNAVLEKQAAAVDQAGYKFIYTNQDWKLVPKEQPPASD